MDEFKFYLEDTEARLVIVPRGDKAAAAIEAAQQLCVPVWETWLEECAGRVRVGLAPVQLPVIRRATASELGVVPEPDDVALFLHTSGTTGRPKGARGSWVKISTKCVLTSSPQAFHLPTRTSSPTSVTSVVTTD